MGKSPYKTSPLDHWLVNGSREFGVMPGGLLDVAPNPAPIYLLRGSAAWGEIHIVNQHGHWLKKHDMDAPTMVWTKCQQSGQAYCTEEEDKFKINLVLHPAALLVLRYIPKGNYFSVVTIYLPEGPLDGTIVGRYVGKKWEGPAPTFTIAEPAPPPIVTIKPKRTFVLPEMPAAASQLGLD